MDEVAGAVFGPYRLGELLGRGGMGEVYRAHHTGQGRVVALKLLLPELSGDADFRRRFVRESRLVAKLTDPHVIPVHGWGEIDGRLYLDMRFVEGEDLAARLARAGPMPPGGAVAVVTQVARALDAAHAAGLVHRDVKPSNVLLAPSADGDDFAYLVDFGIARSAGTGTTTAAGPVGTLAYMAPERFLGPTAGRAADVYALACVLQEALTGRRPFEVEDQMAYIGAHLNGSPTPPTSQDPRVPSGFDAVVARGLEKDPDRRYPTAGALAAAARAVLQLRPPAEPPAAAVTTTAPGRADGDPPVRPPVRPVPDAAPPAAVTRTAPGRAGGGVPVPPDPVRRTAPGLGDPVRPPRERSGDGGPARPPPERVDGGDPVRPPRERSGDGGPARPPAERVGVRSPGPAAASPRSARRSRRLRPPVVVAVLAVGVGVAVAVGLVLARGVGATPTVPPPTTTPVPTLSEADRVLLAALPAGFDAQACVADPSPPAGATAALRCDRGPFTAAGAARFARFRDVPTLDRALAEDAARRQLPPDRGNCEAGVDQQSTWMRNPNEPPAGLLSCYREPGGGRTISWTDRRALALGVVTRSDGNAAALYSWWTKYDFD